MTRNRKGAEQRYKGLRERILKETADNKEEAKKIIATQIIEGLPLLAKLKIWPSDNEPALLMPIAEDLLRWATTTKTFQIEDFALTRGYNPILPARCKEPNFRNAYEYAQYILISRMQKEQEVQEGFAWPKVHRMMRLYHQQFKDDDTKLNNEQAAITFIDAKANDSLGMVEIKHEQ